MKREGTSVKNEWVSDVDDEPLEEGGDLAEHLLVDGERAWVQNRVAGTQLVDFVTEAEVAHLKANLIHQRVLTEVPVLVVRVHSVDLLQAVLDA